MNKDVRVIVKVMGLVAFVLATFGVSWSVGPAINFALLGFTCWYALTQW